MSNIPVWEKSNLTIDEAIEYFSIGEEELAGIMAEDGCRPSLLLIGDRKLIKRRQFEDYLSVRYSAESCGDDKSVVQSAAQHLATKIGSEVVYLDKRLFPAFCVNAARHECLGDSRS